MTHSCGLLHSQTCVFYLTLSNQGSSAASAVTVKVECSVEGGSNAVLHDNSQSPLPQLPATGRHDVIVQTDIKEEGVVSIVASAVYTGRYTSAAELAIGPLARCLLDSLCQSSQAWHGVC